MAVARVPQEARVLLEEPQLEELQGAVRPVPAPQRDDSTATRHSKRQKKQKQLISYRTNAGWRFWG